MFDNSNSEVFTGKLVVAITGRVVEADPEEDEPEGAEAIETDQSSDTMKTSLKSRISITENSRRRNREKKEKQRERIVGKILQKLSH